MKNKNIFILPTTEPSQVYLVKSTNALGLTSNNPESMEHYGSGTHNQHVYITHKDPYDRGDWCIDIEAQEIFKVAEVKEYSGIVRSDTDTYVYDACAKIVLTSDPKLIADGIAEIDIEFLRLLKDKKLDEISTVEIEKTPLLSNNGRALYGYKYTPIIRKKNIVVLAGEDAVKEERERGITITHVNKQETLQQIDQKNPITSGSTALVYKQEQTMPIHILDVENIYVHIDNGIIICEKNDKTIKSYSEDDMREMYNKSCGLIGLGELNDQTENNNRFRELIEKIKTK